VTNERLDEAIDRVASAMTAVAADPQFSARLSGRLHRRAGNIAPLALAASACAVVVLGALVIFQPTADQPALLPNARQAATPSIEAADVRVAAPAEAVVIAASSSPVISSAATEAAGPDDTVPALSIAALTLEPLTLTDVDVSSLDMASLELPDINAGGEPKEPQ